MTLDNYMKQMNVEKHRNIICEYNVPEDMKKMIEEYEGAVLPFGEIFDYETMKKKSQEEPFNNKWLVFGKDGSFSFWVCKINCTSGDIAYTTWDHEAEKTVGEPAFDNIVDFLNDCAKEWDEFDNLDVLYNVILQSYNNKLSLLLNIKKDLNLNLTSKELLIKTKTLPNIIGKVPYNIVKKLEGGQYEYLKEYIRFERCE